MGHSHTGNARIIVLTLSNDAHVPYVARHLSSELIVVDPYRILEKCELSFLYEDGQTVPIYDGQRLTNIKSVWYRRPYIPEREDLKVPDEYKDYAYTAIRKHSHDLFGLFQDAYWLSDHYTILKAETKPRQLELAASLGFRVPKTLTTTSGVAAQAFVDKTAGVVMKSMANTLPIINNRAYHFYTTKIAAGQKADFSGLHVGPTIFQEAIDAELDLRITVVGEQVFSVAIRDKGQQDFPDIRDWRRGYIAGRMHCEKYALPKELQAQCIALTKKLGLDYGAIDLILDKKGRYWFLEINPNGQWAFAEEDTGLPIGKAIAALLEQGNT